MSKGATLCAILKARGRATCGISQGERPQTAAQYAAFCMTKGGKQPTR